MKTWQLREVGHPPTMTEVDEPECPPGEVLIEVRAAGLCHTDVGIIDGQLAEFLAFTPITLGHEFAGVVVRAGDGVTRVVPGDRVAFAAQGAQTPGLGRHGGFAEIVAVPIEGVVFVPANVSYADAAVATDAGATSFNAVHTRGQVRPGHRVGVIGLGGLGLIGAQLAVLAGAEVYGVETKEDVWQRALDLGVKRCTTSARDLASLHLDVIVDFAGTGSTTADAVDVIAAGGRVIVVGAARSESTINTLSLMAKNVEVHGAISASPENTIGVLALLSAGVLDQNITPISFNEIGDGLERLASGAVRGRLVADVSSDLATSP